MYDRESLSRFIHLSYQKNLFQIFPCRNSILTVLKGLKRVVFFDYYVIIKPRGKALGLSRFTIDRYRGPADAVFLFVEIVIRNTSFESVIVIRILKTPFFKVLASTSPIERLSRSAYSLGISILSYFIFVNKCSFYYCSVLGRKTEKQLPSPGFDFSLI